MSQVNRRQIVKCGVASSAAIFGLPLLGHRRARAEARFDFVDIGETQPDAALTTMTLVPTGLTKSGDVVGSVWMSETRNSPYIYSRGKLRRIKSGKYGARVVGVNDDGVLAGRELTGWTDDGLPIGRPAIWVEQEMELLPYPELWNEVINGQASGINNLGQVVGNLWLADGSTVPVVWTDGQIEILPNVIDSPGHEARAINDDGVIAGIGLLPAGGSVPVVWIDGRGYTLPVAEIDGQGYVQNASSSTNGSFLGSVRLEGRSEATVWTDNMDDWSDAQAYLLPRPSEDYLNISAEGANANGVTVGSVAIGESIDSNQALFWQDNILSVLADPVDLEDGVTLIRATKVNDAGQIAGGALWHDGSLHAFLLNPR